MSEDINKMFENAFSDKRKRIIVGNAKDMDDLLRKDAEKGETNNYYVVKSNAPQKTIIVSDETQEEVDLIDELINYINEYDDAIISNDKLNLLCEYELVLSEIRSYDLIHLTYTNDNITFVLSGNTDIINKPKESYFINFSVFNNDKLILSEEIHIDSMNHELVKLFKRYYEFQEILIKKSIIKKHEIKKVLKVG